MMAQTFQQQAALRPPVCPNCKVPMRYQTSELDRLHSNIRHVMFVCSCGLTSDQMMATPD
jgi:RNase P subunit RPR2